MEREDAVREFEIAVARWINAHASTPLVIPADLEAAAIRLGITNYVVSGKPASLIEAVRRGRRGRG